jgi:hypothetical protein
MRIHGTAYTCARPSGRDATPCGGPDDKTTCLMGDVCRPITARVSYTDFISRDWWIRTDKRWCVAHRTPFLSTSLHLSPSPPRSQMISLFLPRILSLPLRSSFSSDDFLGARTCLLLQHRPLMLYSSACMGAYVFVSVVGVCMGAAHTWQQVWRHDAAISQSSRVVL